MGKETTNMETPQKPPPTKPFLSTRPDGTPVYAHVNDAGKARGDFKIEYVREVEEDGTKHFEVVKLAIRFRASEMSLMEERLNRGAREILMMPGIRLAQQVIYIGHLSNAKDKTWTIYAASTVLDEYFDAGGDYREICECYATAVVKAMPDVRQFLEEMGLYTKKLGERLKEEDEGAPRHPTQPSPTGEPIGEGSSSLQPEQG